MDGDDPFAWIGDLCRISSSPDSFLRSFRFGEPCDTVSSPSDNPEIPVDMPIASTSIIMVSPPESPLRQVPEYPTIHLDDEDVFRTPPEGSPTVGSQQVGEECGRGVETVPLNTDGGGSMSVVNLMMVTDPGVSEVKIMSTHKLTLDSNQDEWLKRGLSAEEQQLSGSPSKRWKTSSRPATVEQSFEKLKPQCASRSLTITDGNRDSSERLGVGTQQNHLPSNQAREQDIANRGHDFPIEVTNSEIEERDIECDNNASKREEENIEDLDTGAKDSKAKGAAGEGGGEGLDSSGVGGNTFKAISILDVLKALAKQCECDRVEESLSVMEAAKRRGMTFPQPSWWPQPQPQPVGGMPSKEIISTIDVLKALAKQCECDKGQESVSVMEAAERRGWTFPWPRWWRQPTGGDVK